MKNHIKDSKFSYKFVYLNKGTRLEIQSPKWAKYLSNSSKKKIQSKKKKPLSRVQKNLVLKVIPKGEKPFIKIGKTNWIPKKYNHFWIVFEDGDLQARIGERKSLKALIRAIKKDKWEEII